MNQLQQLPLDKSTKILFNLLEVRVFDLSQTLQVAGHKLSINQLKQNLEKQHNIFGQTQKIFHQLHVYKLFELMRQMSQNYISIASVLIDQQLTSAHAKYKNVTIDHSQEKNRDSGSRDKYSRRSTKRKTTIKKSKMSQEFTQNQIQQCVDSISHLSVLHQKKLGGIHLFNENYVRGIQSVKNKWQAIEAKRRKQYNEKQLLKEMIYKEMTQQVQVEKIHDNDEISKFIKQGKIKHELYYHIQYEKDLENVSIFLKQSQDDAIKFLTDTKKGNQNEDDIIINYHQLIEILSEKKKAQFNMIQNKIKEIVQAFKVKMDHLDNQIQIKDANIRELKYLLKRKQGKQVNTQTIGLRNNLNFSSTSLTAQDMEQQHKAIVEMLRKNIDTTQKQLINLETDVRFKDQTIKKKDNEISQLQAEIQKYKKNLKQQKQKNLQIIKQKTIVQNPVTTKDIVEKSQNEYKQKVQEGSIYDNEYVEEEQVLKSTHRRRNKMLSGQFSPNMVGSTAGQYRPGRQSFLSSGFADVKRMNSLNESIEGMAGHPGQQGMHGIQGTHGISHGYSHSGNVQHPSQMYHEYMSRGQEYRGNENEEYGSQRRKEVRHLSNFVARSRDGGSKTMVSQGSSSDREQDLVGTFKRIEGSDYQKSSKLINVHKQKYGLSQFNNSPYGHYPYASNQHANMQHSSGSYVHNSNGNTPYANSPFAYTPHGNTPHGNTPQGNTQYGNTPHIYSPYTHPPDDITQNLKQYQEAGSDFKRYSETLAKLSGNGYHPNSRLPKQIHPKSPNSHSKNPNQIFQNTLTQRDPQSVMSAHVALRRNAQALYDAIFSSVQPISGQPFVIQEEINKIKIFMSRYNQRQVQNRLKRMFSFLNLSEHTEQIVETQVGEEQDTVQNGTKGIQNGNNSNRSSFNLIDIPSRDSAKNSLKLNKTRQGRTASNRSKQDHKLMDLQGYKDKKSKKVMPSSYFLNKLHAKIRISGKGLNLSKQQFMDMCKDISVSVEQSSFGLQNGQSQSSDDQEEKVDRTLNKQSSIIKYKSRDYIARSSIYKQEAQKKNGKVFKTKGSSVQQKSKERQKSQNQKKKTICKNKDEKQTSKNQSQIQEDSGENTNNQSENLKQEKFSLIKSNKFSITKELEHSILCTNLVTTSSNAFYDKKKQINEIFAVLKSQGAKLQSTQKLEEMMNLSKISIEDLLKIANSLKSDKTEEFMSLFSHQCDRSKHRTNPKSFHIESCCSHAKRYEAFLQKLSITENSLRKLKKDLLNVHIFNIDGNSSQKDFSKKKTTGQKSYKMIDLTNSSSNNRGVIFDRTAGQFDSLYVGKRNNERKKQKKSGSKYLTKKGTVSAYVEAKLKTQTETEQDTRKEGERKSVGNCNSKQNNNGGFLPQLTKKGMSQVVIRE